ncbi:MAG: DUF4338 domain-containing protein [Acidobacteria bacterium]|nr:DUF4338 domain-containing protein [Acidobacteriota bacterium]
MNGNEPATPLTFFGRTFPPAELELMRRVVSEFGALGVTEISLTICELLQWKRPNGGLKNIECRQLLERLQEQGLVSLPPLRRTKPRGPQAVKLTANTGPEEELGGSAGQYEPLRLELLGGGSSGDNALFAQWIERYHYLGFRVPFGAQLRYLVRSERCAGRVLACLLFSSPAWKMAERDRWIGWNDQVRARNLQLIVNHSRFLILPWVRVKGLASKILSHCAHQLPLDWAKLYGYRPLLLETLVDADRYPGTCYRAANWIALGKTQGRGRMDRFHEARVSPKWVYVYPLCRHVRERLVTAAAPVYCEPAEQWDRP